MHIKNKYLAKLVRIGERGLGVKILFVRDAGALGRCVYEEKTIYVKKNIPLRKKIIVLSHELGHWISYLKFRRFNYSRNKRELLGTDYGWYILLNTGLARKFNLTKKDWYKLNEHNYKNVAPDVREAWT